MSDGENSDQNELKLNKLESPVNTIQSIVKDEKFPLRAGIFLASVAGMSAMIGFGATLASVKRTDPSHFDKGLIRTVEMRETGASLAMRALGWGTLYAFTGCGILFYGIWKLSGAQNVKIWIHIIPNCCCFMGKVLNLIALAVPTFPMKKTGNLDLYGNLKSFDINADQYCQEYQRTIRHNLELNFQV